jgi:hypothetical protein
VAFTYKIKPLTWYLRPNGDITTSTSEDCDVIVYKNAMDTYTAHIVGISFRFDTIEEAKEWIEEQHIDNLRKYLEAV